MKELSLHILDLAENSIRAEASLIKILINENFDKDMLTIIIDDDGKGMDKELLESVQDPFTTTRTTRKIGLGVPLMKVAAKRCEGDLKIISEPNRGTKVEVNFKHSHIDRAPLGKIHETIMTLINYGKDIELLYEHQINDEKFKFDTREIKKILDGVDINSPDILDPPRATTLQA